MAMASQSIKMGHPTKVNSKMRFMMALAFTNGLKVISIAVFSKMG
jgi:hypothetical protein